MTNRSRAWRRRKARLIAGKIESTKAWFMNRFEAQAEAGVTPIPHKIVYKRRAQDLRRAWQLQQDLGDGMAG